MNKVEMNAPNSKLLVGFAIDVSGSMESSIRNNTDNQLTRFETFRQVLDHLLGESSDLIQKLRKKGIEASIDIFIYGFGFKEKIGDSDLIKSGVCDFLTLMKVGHCLASSNEQDIINCEEYVELKNLANQYNLGNLVEDKRVASFVQNNREKAGNFVKRLKDNTFLAGSAACGLSHLTGTKTLWDGPQVTEKLGMSEDIMKYYSQTLNSSEKLEFRLEDTTLPIDEAMEFFDHHRETMNNAKQFIYGLTPMREALIEVKNRFKRELAIRPQNTIPILFLLSDGVPTDGNPLLLAQELKSLNIVIVSCFVTDEDIANPRILFGSSESEWSDGAKLMFNMASNIEENSKFARFLLKKGWKINSHGRLFVQVNHSDILQEFIRVILSPLEDLEKINLPQRGI